MVNRGYVNHLSMFFIKSSNYENYSNKLFQNKYFKVESFLYIQTLKLDGILMVKY